ncbi:MAG: hypothetical protein K6B65_04645 [Bacilli bacterium]|nr:hypothetical protein [Bacilli bacterium]
MKALLIAAAIALPFIFAIAVGVGNLLFMKRNEKPYSFLRYFPFELIPLNSPQRALGYFSIIFYALVNAGLPFLALFLKDQYTNIYGLIVFLGVLNVVKEAAMVGLFFVPAYHFKPHLILTVAYFCAGLLFASVTSILFANLNVFQSVYSVSFLVCEVVLGVILLGLLLNPRLARWTELKSVMEEDGSMSTYRPKPFVLAFSQWLAIALDCLMVVLYLLGLFFFSIL